MKCTVWNCFDTFIPKDFLAEKIIKEIIFGLFDTGSESFGIDTAFDHERKWPRVKLNIPARIMSVSIHPEDSEAKTATVLKDISYGGALLSPVDFERWMNPFTEFKLAGRQKQQSSQTYRGNIENCTDNPWQIAAGRCGIIYKFRMKAEVKY